MVNEKGLTNYGKIKRQSWINKNPSLVRREQVEHIKLLLREDILNKT